MAPLADKCEDYGYPLAEIQIVLMHIVRVGFDRWLTALKHYDNEFKMHRKLMHNLIGTRAAMERFEELEEIETRRFILKVLNTPDNLLNHIRA